MAKHRIIAFSSVALWGAMTVYSTTRPALAQTTVWTEPTKTERWTESGNATPPAPKPTARPNPAKPNPAKPVAPRGKVDPRLVGVWDVRIPTGVTYQRQGEQTYQRITPGANFNRLTIQANGAYQWGAQKGTLKEVRPYFIMEGQRYFEVARDKQNKYLIRYNERDNSLAMFFDVGGFVAKGTRVATGGSTQSSKKRPVRKTRPANKAPRRR